MRVYLFFLINYFLWFHNYYHRIGITIRLFPHMLRGESGGNDGCHLYYSFSKNFLKNLIW